MASLLIVSDRQARHECDDGLYAFARYFDTVEFAYIPGGYGTHSNDNSFVLTRDWIEQLSSNQYTHVYCRVDYYHKSFKDGYVEAVLRKLVGAVKIVGYHCHNARCNSNEHVLFDLADIILLLNEQAKSFFMNSLPFLSHKKIDTVNSLYLPPISWYTSEVQITTSNDIQMVAISAVNRTYPVVDRYNILRFIEGISPNLDLHIHLYGRFENDESKKIYEQALSSHAYTVYGRVPENILDAQMFSYDFGLMNGFMPGDYVSEFEHQNYAMRFNSYLKSRTIPLIAKGTCGWHEDYAMNTGFGIVFDDTTDFVDLLGTFKTMRTNNTLFDALCRENCAEAFAAKVSSLL